MSQPAERSIDPDFLEIIEDAALAVPTEGATWRVLVVDDDEDVHHATEFALRHAVILGRPVETIHARSGAEARAAVDRVGDIAVALVDVVMETPDAGLNLVRRLRETGYSAMRIVLRTGYPGYAPEGPIIAEYEIDDYRTKDELTQTRMVSVLTASIRAYDQICTISRTRAGLEMIVRSSAHLFRRTNLEIFSQGVLSQIGALLRTRTSGFVCVQGKDIAGADSSCIVSAIGEFTDMLGKGLSVVSPELIALVDVARGRADPLFRDGYMVLHFTSETGRELCAVLEMTADCKAAEISLLRLFAANIAVGFENLALVEELDRLAFSVPVLGVPNPNAFEAALGSHLTSDRDDKRLALISIGSFDTTVATYGLPLAHKLLLEVFDRLASLSGGATVAIVGEATFGLIGHRDIVTSDLMERVFARSYRVDDVELVAVASSAIVDLRDLPDDRADALRIATTALVHIRQTRPGEPVLYGTEMQKEVERTRQLQMQLKAAILKEGELEVYLQPKVDLSTNTVLGAEALLRWIRRDETIPPDEFIPIAEGAGLTQPLTDFVFRKVADWVHAHDEIEPVPVAVNLSMADLNRPGFAAWAMQRLDRLGLTPRHVEFEVTEGIAMHDAQKAVEQARELKRAGFRIALDDFGTGFSSLSQFSRLPIDTLKIDRSFVSLLDVSTARRSLAAIALMMTTALNVDCVAEGIETDSQKQALVFLGCRVGQGFLLGRPTPIGQFNETFGLTASEWTARVGTGPPRRAP